MPKYIDADGNEIETLSPEEVSELQQKTQTEEGRNKILEQELNETKVMLSKLQNQDYSFKKLKDLTEEQKKALTAKEMELMQFQEATEEKIKKASDEANSIRNLLTASWKKNAITALNVSLEEEQKKVFDDYYNQLIAGKEQTEDVIAETVKNAFAIVKSQTRTTGGSQILGTGGDGTGFGDPKKINKDDPLANASEGVKELAKVLNF